MLKAFRESSFDTDPRLFVKLINGSEEEVINLINFLTSEVGELEEREEKLKINYEGTIGNLNNELDKKTIVINELENNLKNQINKLRESEKLSKDLTSKLQQDEKTIKHLQDELNNKHVELKKREKEKWLLSKIETNHKFLPQLIEQYMYLSLGKVVTLRSGDIRILRVADFINEKFEPFIPQKGLSRNFDNREYLFPPAGTPAAGAYGFWCWSWSKNLNIPEKDYVESIFLNQLKGVEVIRPSSVLSLNSLIKYTNGEHSFHRPGWDKLFIVKNEIGGFNGIFAESAQFERSNLKYRLKPEVHYLPLFRFTQADFFYFDNSIFYKRLLPNPQQLIETVKLKEPREAVKEYFLDKLAELNSENESVTPEELDKFKFFILEEGRRGLSDFASKYGYSESEALVIFELLSEITLEKVETARIAEKLLLKSLSENQSLNESLKQIVRKEWEVKNQEEIKRKEQIISQLKEEKHTAEIEKTKAETEVKRIEGDLTKINERIAEANKIKEDAEVNLKKSIQAIKENASSFVSQLALLSPFLVQQTPPLLSNKPRAILKSEFSVNDYDLQEIEAEEISLYIEENLEDSGFSTSAISTLGCVISFCLAAKVPIICNGNADVIAKVMSAALGASSFSVVVDSQEISSLLLEKDKEGEIFVFPNLFEQFSSSLFNQVEEIFNCSKWGAVVISSEGIPIEDLPYSVLDRSLFIDTDTPFERDLHKPLQRTKPVNFQYCSKDDAYTWRKARGALEVFDSILSHKAMALYAELQTFCKEIDLTPTTLLQIYAQAKSQNLLDTFEDIMKEKKIDFKIPSSLAK